jgi:hypothetical protein
MSTPPVNSMALLAPCDSQYDPNTTVQLTVERKNQKIDDISNHLSGIAQACFSLMKTTACCYGSAIQVQPSQDVIIAYYGVVTEILREPGIYWFNGLGLETHTVYVGGWQGTIYDQPMKDGNAYPYYVSANYNFQVIDPLAAVYKTKNFQAFIKKQAKIALQKIFAQTPYHAIHFTKAHEKAQNLLQTYVSSIGLQINNFRITGVKIDQHMQKLLLAKQEAQAFVNGRKTIALGATSIIESTLTKLKEQRIQLTQQEKNALAVNLTYMICHGNKVSLEYIQGDPTAEEMNAFVTIEQPKRRIYDDTQCE